MTWKSIVGTNVAADALSNLASPGVLGGALVIIGEDYGEGASVIQERSHAFAMKSALWLLDPRPDLTSLVRLVQQAFELYLSNFPSYTAVYGAFATLPMFLVWLYLSWAVVLIGALVAATLPEFRSGGNSESVP